MKLFYFFAFSTSIVAEDGKAVCAAVVPNDCADCLQLKIDRQVSFNSKYSALCGHFLFFFFTKKNWPQLRKRHYKMFGFVMKKLRAGATIKITVMIHWGVT